MKAYIHAFRGRPWNEECDAAYNGFRKLGIECVLFTTNEELDAREKDDIVVGGMIVMGHIFDTLGIKPPNINYPYELNSFLGRKIWNVKLKDLRKEKLPIFIKPLEEKAAKGVIVRSWEDASEYEPLGADADIICSEVIDIVSEWRCFMMYGKLVGIRHYHGDSSRSCDESIINAAVKAYKTAPAGCSLDFGVTTDGKTLLIEVNDGFSIGCYGLPDELYAKLLMARWAELLGAADPLDKIT